MQVLVQSLPKSGCSFHPIELKGLDQLLVLEDQLFDLADCLSVLAALLPTLGVL